MKGGSPSHFLHFWIFQYLHFYFGLTSWCWVGPFGRLWSPWHQRCSCGQMESSPLCCCHWNLDHGLTERIFSFKLLLDTAENKTCICFIKVDFPDPSAPSNRSSNRTFDLPVPLLFRLLLRLLSGSFGCWSGSSDASLIKFWYYTGGRSRKGV